TTLSVVAIPVGIACSVTWLVLPFAGIDLLVAVFVFRNVKRYVRFECMIVRGDQAMTERWYMESVSRFELHRSWEQVGCTRALQGDRLVLWSRGNEVELGINLTHAQRAA
ncbi:MAG: DUF2244 domain-containing protein, partial [Betaproteobacteria bacterium]